MMIALWIHRERLSPALENEFPQSIKTIKGLRQHLMLDTAPDTGKGYDGWIQMIIIDEQEFAAFPIHG
jgi:hypothetical protein